MGKKKKKEKREERKKEKTLHICFSPALEVSDCCLIIGLTSGLHQAKLDHEDNIPVSIILFKLSSFTFKATRSQVI